MTESSYLEDSVTVFEKKRSHEIENVVHPNKPRENGYYVGNRAKKSSVTGLLKRPCSLDQSTSSLIGGEVE